MTDRDPTTPPSTETRDDTPVARLDRWMSLNVWHPRIVPYFAYIVLLMLIGFIPDQTVGLYPVLYVAQCLIVVWLLWRYRKLIPEMNWRFHWLAIPSGLGLCVAWIALGYLYNIVIKGDLAVVPSQEEERFQPMLEASPALFWGALVLRLLGMSIVVPMCEELFTRSAILRGLSDPRKTFTGTFQLLCDLPVIGDWLSETETGRKAQAQPSMFTVQLEETPLMRVTLFGVFTSTVLFMLAHGLRDWMGCIACGIVWCAMVAWTNRRSLSPEKRLGLGPVIWSHAITNAALWAWTVFGQHLPQPLGQGGDWQFL